MRRIETELNISIIIGTELSFFSDLVSFCVEYMSFSPKPLFHMLFFHINIQSTTIESRLSII